MVDLSQSSQEEDEVDKGRNSQSMHTPPPPIKQGNKRKAKVPLVNDSERPHKIRVCEDCNSGARLFLWHHTNRLQLISPAALIQIQATSAAPLLLIKCLLVRKECMKLSKTIQHWPVIYYCRHSPTLMLCLVMHILPTIVTNVVLLLGRGTHLAVTSA